MNQTPKHPLRGLLLTQFCGAFNDNAWRLMVVLLAIKQLTAQLGEGPALEAASQAHTTFAMVMFTVPLMVISLFASVVADRVSKRTLIVVTKAAEIALMAAGTVVLFANPAGGLAPLIVLGLMGVQSALFSPAKYGILPEILPHHRLSWGNGLLEMWTFLAIIAGSVCGGLLLDLSGQAPWLAGLALTTLALVGMVGAWDVPPVAAARNEGGLTFTLQGAWSAVRTDRILRLAILGSVFFWTLASLVGQDVLIYSRVVLQLPDATLGLPLATFSIGIALGATLAGKLSASKVEYGLIPLGTSALAAFLFLFGLATPGMEGTLACMILLGLASGLIVVPINATIQWRAPADRRGAVIALSNVVVFGGVLVGSLSSGALAQLGLSASAIIVAAAASTAALTLWTLWLLPDAFLRLALVLLTHTFYKVTVVGRDHVPQQGGALLVPNHVSFVDGLLLIASLDRPLRFVVDARYYNHPLLKPLGKAMGAIPISSSGSPREILGALREAGRLLDEGELVCIFPEGQITRTGAILPFRSGYERIVKGKSTPIIPVHLDRVWGSIFSYIGGRFLTKLPERIPYPITVSFGQPLPAQTAASDVRQAVQAMGEAAWWLRKPTRVPLHRSFIRSMRRRPLRFAFGDLTRPKVSGLQALTGIIALARVLRPHWEGQPTVGILLPPSVGGALVNVAATLAGRTTVNLNYTAGRDGMGAAARLSGLRTVVTSRLFVEKAKLELPENVTYVWIDDVRKQIGAAAKALALLMALFAPVRFLEIAAGAARSPTMDDLATIIFSSGSTGEPKGVMLSQFSIDSNVQAVSQVLHVGQEDRVLGILPFFHSFGYLTTLWFAPFHGVGVVFHPSPLDAGPIGELIDKYRLTMLMATPTFLQLYLRRCPPEQLGSLRVVLTGAEKLSERLAQAFEDRFGIMPIEGYGVTECAPVITVNSPDYRAAGFYQPGTKRGTVGRPLPGVTIRIVDPDTFEPLPTGSAGLLLVKGPNVMNGYIGREDLTAQAMRDGWYITGDIAMIDEDGFVQITDRLSRFSKIGGEMVPHGRVEEALHQAVAAETQTFAVTSVPDEKKGEQLAVLHTLDDDAIPQILQKVAASGLPNLFIPRRDHFLKVEAIPVLGTGKLDLRGIKKVAMKHLGLEK